MATRAGFIEPMLLLRTDALPDDAARWEYQLKLDGFRAVAFKIGGKVHLRSRNDNDFSLKYPAVVEGLSKLPDDTAIDGEIVAVDADGRPSFSLLQDHGSSKAPILFFAFDVMVLAGRDVMREPLRPAEVTLLHSLSVGSCRFRCKVANLPWGSMPLANLDAIALLQPHPGDSADPAGSSNRDTRLRTRRNNQQVLPAPGTVRPRLP